MENIGTTKILNDESIIAISKALKHGKTVQLEYYGQKKEVKILTGKWSRIKNSENSEK